MNTELGTAKKRGRPKGVGNAPRIERSKRAEGKLEGEAFNKVAWGHEPQWDTKEDYDTFLGFALNWYSVNSTSEKSKKWTIEYLTSINYPKLNDLNKVPDRVFTTIGSVARLATRGIKLSDKHKQYIVEQANLLVRENKEKLSTEVLIIPAKKRMDPIQRQLISAIEEVTDKYLISRSTAVLANFDFPRLVTSCRADVGQVRKVLQSLEPRTSELQGALSGDKELKEAYSHMTPKQITVLVNFYSKVLHQGLEVAPKKTRKPRTKKPKSAEKILKKFQHKRSDNELKIESADPKDILGADELWVFNTKTRKLGFFKAAENEKLSVTGTSIRGYNEETSFCKKLRKPVEQLAQVKSLSKPATKKYVANIRSKEAVLRSRINEDTLLVRVF